VAVGAGAAVAGAAVAGACVGAGAWVGVAADWQAERISATSSKPLKIFIFKLDISFLPFWLNEWLFEMDG
jgi:hypothetical protein